MSYWEKHFPKIRRKDKINVKMPYVKKPQARNGNLVQTKKSGPRMNYEWTGKTI